MADLHDTLVALEREGWQALSTEDGGSYYRRRLAAEAAMAFPFGVLDRAESIKAMESAPPWSGFEIDSPRVLPLADDGGVVVYRVAAQRAGQQPYRAVISSTYVRQDDDWKLVFHQQSPY